MKPGNITFTMIKPNAVKHGYIGTIMNDITAAGFRIQAIKMLQMSCAEAEKFYAVHKERVFFESLVNFMSSGPIIAAVLTKENAVEEYRKLIGSTDPDQAALGTIRHKYAESIQANAVHGSDSDENAEIEASFFFAEKERFDWDLIEV